MAIANLSQPCLSLGISSSLFIHFATALHSKLLDRTICPPCWGVLRSSISPRRNNGKISALSWLNGEIFNAFEIPTHLQLHRVKVKRPFSSLPRGKRCLQYISKDKSLNLVLSIFISHHCCLLLYSIFNRKFPNLFTARDI